MVGLPEIDEFESQSFVDHDVGGLEVEMDHVVGLEVAQTLHDDDTEVDLGVEGHRVAVLSAVVVEVGVRDVVGDQVPFMSLVLLGQQIVLGHVDGETVLHLQ